MDAELYERFFDVEDTYWWSVGTRRVFADWLRRALPAIRPAILDVGCGTGALTHELDAFAAATGVDLSPQAVAFTRRRGVGRLCVARGEALPFRTASFDGVVAADIIEHTDDVGTLREIARVLRPGGAALLHVPAFPFLWGEHDEVNHHLRRYWPAQLRAAVAAGGLRVERVSFLNAFVFPAALAVRLTKRALRRIRPPRPPQAEIYSLPPSVNRWLTRMMAVEQAALHRLDFPVGVSLLCLARKP